MTGTFLEKILLAKRSRLAKIAESTDVTALRKSAHETREDAGGFRLSRALSQAGQPNIIAEIKRASPSRGPICMEADVAEIAREYAAGGASAISVLTEEDFFAGSLEDLRRVRAAVEVPLLRKDFIVDEIQIYEAAAAGADAILLIVAALNEKDLSSYLEVARGDLRMDAIVEVHDEIELKAAFDAGATLIGVNNRNLKTFDVSLEVSRSLIPLKRKGSLFISESGISEHGEVAELATIGFDGFLVGESLMRQGIDRGDAIARLRGSLGAS